MIIKDCADHVQGCWSKSQNGNSAEEGEAYALLYSLQVILKNNLRTVYLKGDNKYILKAPMQDDMEAQGYIDQTRSINELHSMISSFCIYRNINIYAQSLHS